MKALRWDVEIGMSYKKLTELDAWKNLVAQLYMVRDAHLNVLVSGEGDQAAAREGVRAIDALLLTPQTMIMYGEESEKELRLMQSERNGNGR